MSPEYRSPYHLKEWAGMIERCASEPVRGLCSIPTRHYKTVTTLHGVIWILFRRPTWRIVLIGHDHRRAEWMGKQTRILRDRAGLLPLRGDDTIAHWSTSDGGGVHVISADQSAIGYDAHVVIADDPIDERGFNDPAVRDQVDASLNFYASRAGGGGKLGSFLLVMSRGHPDDPIGRRLTRKAVTWAYVHDSAIIDEGKETERAFAPDVWDLPALKRNRDEIFEADPTGRIWHSQWQNDPLPDSLGLFKSPARYETLPTTPGFRTVYGLDLAYSARRHADYLALVVLRIWPEWTEEGRREVAYVAAVWRERWDPAQAVEICKMARALYPGGTFFSYMAGPEIASAHYLAEQGIEIQVMPARYSKRHRAQASIDKSNAGRIRFPTSAPWVNGMVARLMLFSGDENAGDDDEIDALVSAVDGGMKSAVSVPKALGPRRI
jgi:hypothetical protein